MNNSNQLSHDDQMKLINEAVEIGKKVAEKISYKFVIDSTEGDGVDFHINGYSFTIVWEEIEVQSIGKIRKVPMYELITYYSTYGSRINPPEMVDKSLFKSRVLFEIIDAAFVEVFKDTINHHRESLASPEDFGIYEIR